MLEMLQVPEQRFSCSPWRGATVEQGRSARLKLRNFMDRADSPFPSHLLEEKVKDFRMKECLRRREGKKVFQFLSFISHRPTLFYFAIH